MAPTTSKPPIASTAAGELRGAWENGIAAFRGVPFAAPPVGRLRFAPPEPHSRWQGVRVADKNGPIAPQIPARLAQAMGDYTLPMEEDCLTLTVWTPEAGSGKRPVMVFLHGGAFVTGAGSLGWYDGGSFAREHGLVVVGVNYRLGTFGFLTLDGVSPGNLGIRDQIAALEWVKANIAAFGGDASAVTIFGESAGGYSVYTLLATPKSRGLFRRAMIQSAPIAFFQTAEQSQGYGRKLAETAGVKPAELRNLTTAQIMEAQVAFNRANAQFAFPSLPLRPHADGELIPEKPHEAALERTREVEVVIGWTRDEMAAFFTGVPEIENVTQARLEEVFALRFGDRAAAMLQMARARRPGAKPSRLLEAGVTEAVFAAGSYAFAERAAAAGRPMWVYRFDWAAPNNPFGACHTIELPFVFNSIAAWDAPMLRGGDPAEMANLARVMHKTWATFAKKGDPNYAELPAWPRYEPQRRWSLRIDRFMETVGDVGGVGLAEAAKTMSRAAE